MSGVKSQTTSKENNTTKTMKKSKEISSLATALNKAQAQMSGAKKTAKNPFFKSAYANLEEVINCIREPFADNGLSFMQFPITEENRAGVDTIIMHSSGEWISHPCLLTCAKNDPQGMGSAITYARRYGLQSAVGLPSEDDDGNAATRPMAKAKPAAKPQKSATKTQIANIDKLLTKSGFDDDKVDKAVSWASGGAHSNVADLTQPQAAKLISFITEKIK